MKMKYAVSLALVLLLGGLVVTPTGCTTSAQRITYNTLYSLETATTTAYDAFLDQVVAGKVSTAKVPEVSKAYNAFQASMTAAIAAAQFNWQSPAPADVTTLATAVLHAIQVATGK